MHWIYILEMSHEDEDEWGAEYEDIEKCYYVGETMRLFTRNWEHENGNGALNTSIYNYKKIVAIYKMCTICKFIDYNTYVNQINEGIWHNDYESFKLKNFNNKDTDEECECGIHEAENNIVECTMTHKKEAWKHIRGGKYTRFDVEYTYPNNKYIKHLPLCNCGLPCDVKYNEDKNHLFFRCAKKNMWDKFKEQFDVEDEPCKFYKEYTEDYILKIEEKVNFEKRQNIFKELRENSKWLKNVPLNDENYPHQCVGGCHRTSKSIKMKYYYKRINLCFNCFINKNKELEKKYDLNIFGKRKCLIKIG